MHTSKSVSTNYKRKDHLMKNLRKTTKILFSMAIVLSMLFTAFAQEKAEKASEEKKEDTKVIAKVGKEEVTEAELDKVMKEWTSRFPVGRLESLPEERMQELKKRILNQHLEKMLILQKAEEMGAKPNEEEIKEELQSVKDRFPDEEAFKNALQQQGKTVEDLEKDIREGLTIRAVMDKITEDSVQVTEEEMKEFYEENSQMSKQEPQVKASHILLKVEQDMSEEDKAEIEKELQQIRKDIINEEAEFSQMAKKNSDCPSSAKGGDLGWFGKGKMVPEFEKAAFDLKPGEVSEVVKTDFGYHIIKVTDKKEAKDLSFEEMKDDIKEQLQQREKGEAFMNWLEKAKAEKVSIMVPEYKLEKMPEEMPEKGSEE